MPNYCYCGRSEMQPFCDGSHNVVPARKPRAEGETPSPSPEPSVESKVTAESNVTAETPRPGLLRRLFGRG